jgi:hypothetical protein
MDLFSRVSQLPNEQYKGKTRSRQVGRLQPTLAKVSNNLRKGEQLQGCLAPACPRRAAVL